MTRTAIDQRVREATDVIIRCMRTILCSSLFLTCGMLKSRMLQVLVFLFRGNSWAQQFEQRDW
jgi:hypothetical protein